MQQTVTCLFLPSLFPWLSDSVKNPRVSPLEFAATFEEMMDYW